MEYTTSKMTENNTDFNRFMPLMNAAVLPGRCMDYIGQMGDEHQKRIARAEYYYFSGQPEKAVKETRMYLDDTDIMLRLSACLIYSYANLSLGNISEVEYGLEEIQAMSEFTGKESVPVRSVKDFTVSAASVLLHLPCQESLSLLEKRMQLLPFGLRSFSMYVLCHHLYLKQEYGKSVGMSEAALMMGAEKYLIPGIYLHLVAVMNYMSLKETEKAKNHLVTAWEMACPDNLIEGFGEHHGLLGGMLESVIKPGWPEDFKRMIHITYRFSEGWRKIHNPVTGENVADDLTTTEFAVAMLAARGWTNAEIAAHLNISPNTVKLHLSHVMSKVGVSSRYELKKFMLR